MEQGKAISHHRDYTPFTDAAKAGPWPAKECPWFPVPLPVNAARLA
jgi:hypothetical protein